MISVGRVEVTGQVSGEPPVMVGGTAVDVRALTVTYVRTLEGAWVHEDAVRILGANLPHPAHLESASSGYPKWVGDFVTAACPDHRGVFSCPPILAPSQESS